VFASWSGLDTAHANRFPNGKRVDGEDAECRQKRAAVDGHSLKPFVSNPSRGKSEGPDMALVAVSMANRNPASLFQENAGIFCRAVFPLTKESLPLSSFEREAVDGGSEFQNSGKN